MLPSKTAGAFLFSCDRLFAESEHVYFWTFTFRQVPRSDEWALWQWNAFMTVFKRHFPLHRGVRVIELHKSHGAHFHALINARIPIDRLQRMAYPMGFGVMWVEQCDSGTANYLAKYLTKSYREENHFAKGRRRWGAIGGFKVVRCRDVSYETDYTRSRTALYNTKQISFGMTLCLQSWTRLWGEYKHWPDDIKSQWKEQEYEQQKKDLLARYRGVHAMHAGQSNLPVGGVRPGDQAGSPVSRRASEGVVHYELRQRNVVSRPAQPLGHMVAHELPY
jgi:hypothetical protein